MVAIAFGRDRISQSSYGLGVFKQGGVSTGEGHSVASLSGHRHGCRRLFLGAIKGDIARFSPIDTGWALNALRSIRCVALVLAASVDPSLKRSNALLVFFI